MHISVKSGFRAFNEPIEGVVRYMYLDIKGLVTIGVGNLIDPMGEALALPFRYKNRPAIRASQSEIEAEWKLIKGNTALARRGHRACEPLTNLELDDIAIDTLVNDRLLKNEGFLKRQNAFIDFDKWPADAQLGLLSMAWALGPGFSNKWPRFRAACEKMDFDAAAENCRMRESDNPGVIPRNRANRVLFQNAAAVLAGEGRGFYRREILYYPSLLLKPSIITGSPELYR
jgi:hypothetical protein